MNILKHIEEVKNSFPSINLLDIDTFIDNMLMSLQLVCASEGMLSEAINVLRNMEGSFEESLLQYFLIHLSEEKGHFNWMKEDLEGIEIKCNWDALEVAGTQYYLIKHVHPACILGYMAVLECFPMPKEAVDKLEELHGEKIMRTVKYHSIHDVEHGKDVLKMIDAAPESLKEWITYNALNTARRLGEAQQKFGVKDA